VSAVKDRIIFLCDCDAFFASVEELFHPELKKAPMAVCGNPENRHGIILAKNQLAKGFGVKTAETIGEAKRKCPELVLAPARRGEYSKYCGIVNGIYGQYTDIIERGGIDESYLDVTGSLHLFGGEPVGMARRIQAHVLEETGLTVSIGISFNKIFAKLASEIKKPNGVSLVSRENYKTVVWPMPASALFLVGKKTAEELSRMNIATIGQLAAADEEWLTRRLGKLGEQLHTYANGLDDAPVQESDDIASVGNGMTFRRNLVTRGDIATATGFLADEVARRMRRYDVKCMTVQVSIKDTSLKVITRQKALERPTWLAAELAREAAALIEASWKPGAPIRMLTITAQKLLPAGESTEQTTLFCGEHEAESREKRERLEKAMDKVRDKYGFGSISAGSVIKNDLGIGED
jgi:DNA polymerase-4